MARLLLAVVLAGAALAAVLWWTEHGRSPLPLAGASSGTTSSEPEPIALADLGESRRPLAPQSDPDAADVPRAPGFVASGRGDGTDGHLTLRLVRTTDGAPVRSSVGVRHDTDSGWTWTDTESGPDGSAAFQLSVGRTLWVSVDEHFEAHWNRKNERGELELAPLRPGERRDVEIALTPLTIPFEGRVLAGNFAPIEGAKVSFGPLEIVRTSGPGGRFSLDVPRKTLRLTVTAEGYSPQEVVIQKSELDERETFDVILDRPARLRVLVIDPAGRPVDGAIVWLAEPSRRPARWGKAEYLTRTGADGRCTIEGIPPRIEFSVEMSRWSWKQRHPERLELEPEETAEVLFALRQEVTLTGTVVDEAGEPVACRLFLYADVPPGDSYRVSGTPVDKRRSDEDGRFRFQHLHAGDWWILPRSQLPHFGPRERELNLGFFGGGVETSRALPSPAPLARVVSIPVGVEEWDVELRVHSGLWIHGRVVDPHGNPARSRVDVKSLDFPGDWTRSTSTDGRFELGPFAPGRFELRAPRTSTAPGFLPSPPLPVRAGDENVLLVLEPGDDP